MSTAVVIRDPKAYVTPDVWEREVALLLRNPENTREAFSVPWPDAGCSNSARGAAVTSRTS
ncbi:hypothetical protein [Streptomyces sp. P17]|uniref:hypothetical protein n=1 Tax=Streptomyces sp. P17 TaxID=3074716 RepID=UPI0028F434AA|nr:hypothetical protein [Streptomyces sp. P17]MDT9697018.1 hypothetical protein [Streptomyces sp. P17]